MASRKVEWSRFRSQIIEIDKGRCVRCNRSQDEGAILHVHHKEYITGREYWDYPLEMMETLCAGCHAKEHGIISPDCGWNVVDDEDHGFLGGGSCDYCGTLLRYSYRVEHSNWPPMDVGEDCSNLLTRTSEASELGRQRKTRDKRREAFIESGGWNWNEDDDNPVLARHISRYLVRIAWEPLGYRIYVGRKRGEKLHSTVAEAKEAAFDAIEWLERKKLSRPLASP